MVHCKHLLFCASIRTDVQPDGPQHRKHRSEIPSRHAEATGTAFRPSLANTAHCCNVGKDQGGQQAHGVEREA